MKYLLLPILPFLFIACSDGTIDGGFDFSICDQISENYKIYEGEEVGCQFHYFLAVYDGREYLELNSYCADLSRAFIIDDNCIDICDPLNNTAPACDAYLAGRDVGDIVFIQQ